MRAFFGTYTKAWQGADELLFRAGEAAAIDEASYPRKWQRTCMAFSPR
jgi:hypothetical protein